MKKLIMAIAVVVTAAAVQAASFDWKTSATGKIYGAGTTTLLASGTAYIFDAAENSQQSVLDAFVAGGAWTTGSLNNKSVAAGVIAGTNAEAFNYGTAGNTYNFYVALVDGGNIFISDYVSADAKGVGYAQASFNLKNASQAAAMASSTFTAGGWYTAVPEPTSGLLLLLGMAGLALKRKRA